MNYDDDDGSSRRIDRHDDKHLKCKNLPKENEVKGIAAYCEKKVGMENKMIIGNIMHGKLNYRQKQNC